MSEKKIVEKYIKHYDSGSIRVEGELEWIIKNYTEYVKTGPSYHDLEDLDIDQRYSEIESGSLDQFEEIKSKYGICRKIGIWKYYYENGSLECQGQFIYNMINHKGEKFWVVDDDGIFKYGRDGLWEFYELNTDKSTLCKKINYKHGKHDGFIGPTSYKYLVITFFNENGTIKNEQYYKNGFPIHQGKIIKKIRSIKDLEEFVKSKRLNLYKSKNKDDIFYIRGNYEHELSEITTSVGRHGLWVSKFDNKLITFIRFKTFTDEEIFLILEELYDDCPLCGRGKNEGVCPFCEK